MAATKLKPNETIGDHLPILTWQVNRIMKNCSYKDDIKAEWVQWVTGDVNRASLKSITQAQAKQIIMTQEGSMPLNQPKQTSDNWAHFDKTNTQHNYILALCLQKGWSVKNERFGEVADLPRLSNWLKSEKSPVRKPLKSMTPQEVSKIISALENMTIKHFNK